MSFHYEFSPDLLNLNERKQHKVLAVFCFSFIRNPPPPSNTGSVSARMLIRSKPFFANHTSDHITISLVLLSKRKRQFLFAQLSSTYAIILSLR